MNVYVFGNPILKEDNLALRVAKKLKEDFPKINFIHKDPNEELNERNLVILDVAKGINKVEVIESLDDLELEKRYSLHDYDLAFNLKLMKKINLIDKVKIIAIPINYPLKKACEEVAKILSI